MINLTLKKRILFNVYAICCVRKLRNPFVAEFLIFATLGIILSYLISVPNVLTNMLNSGNFYHYFIVAFSNSGLLVQTILVLVIITILFFMRNIGVYTIIKQRFA